MITKTKRLYRFVLLSIAVSLLIFTLFTVSKTFSKYLTSAQGNSNIAIAKWNIKVNKTQITSGTDLSQKIEPILPGNKHIKKGIIAPTAEGYFDLDLEFVDVDVSFKYEINIAQDETNKVKDLIVTGYKLDNDPEITFNATDDKKITEEILLNSNIKERKIRVFFTWNDNIDTEKMNNKQDTLTTIGENASTLLNVKISFIQIAE